jgi:hypothetical protein
MSKIRNQNQNTKLDPCKLNFTWVYKEFNSRLEIVKNQQMLTLFIGKSLAIYEPYSQSF